MLTVDEALSLQRTADNCGTNFTMTVRIETWKVLRDQIGV